MAWIEIVIRMLCSGDNLWMKTKAYQRRFLAMTHGVLFLSQWKVFSLGLGKGMGCIRDVIYFL
jgi:hypothetical protein